MKIKMNRGEGRKLPYIMGLRRVTAFIISVIICLSQSYLVFADSFNRNLLNGVVYIQSIVPINDNPKVLGDYLLKSGTGFFVGNNKENPEYILTSRSVISDYLKAGGAKGNGQLFIAFDRNDVEEVYYIDSDADKDVAILKVGKPTEKRIPLSLFVIDESYQGKPAYAIGFPVAADVDVNAVERLNPGQATVTGGNISRLLLQSKTGTPLIQFDASVSSGSSGGPLVDEKGTVIGICSPLSSTGNSLNYAVNTSVAIQLLEKNNIAYVIGAGFPILLFALIGMAVVAIFALIVVLVIFSQKKKTPVKGQAPPMKGNAPPINGSPQTSLKKAFICSHSAQHPSLKIGLTANPIVIGRDQRTCKIVFKEGTAGVSGKHCQVSFDSQTQNAILMDIGSTYGTFLSSGQKLAPNVPNVLKQGDGFYLGEAANSFYIEMENV